MSPLVYDSPETFHAVCAKLVSWDRYIRSQEVIVNGHSFYTIETCAKMDHRKLNPIARKTRRFFEANFTNFNILSKDFSRELWKTTASLKACFSCTKYSPYFNHIDRIASQNGRRVNLKGLSQTIPSIAYANKNKGSLCIVCSDGENVIADPVLFKDLPFFKTSSTRIVLDNFSAKTVEKFVRLVYFSIIVTTPHELEEYQRLVDHIGNIESIAHNNCNLWDNDQAFRNLDFICANGKRISVHLSLFGQVPFIQGAVEYSKSIPLDYSERAVQVYVDFRYGKNDLSADLEVLFELEDLAFFMQDQDLIDACKLTIIELQAHSNYCNFFCKILIKQIVHCNSQLFKKIPIEKTFDEIDKFKPQNVFTVAGSPQLSIVQQIVCIQQASTDPADLRANLNSWFDQCEDSVWLLNQLDALASVEPRKYLSLATRQDARLLSRAHKAIRDFNNGSQKIVDRNMCAAVYHYVRQSRIRFSPKEYQSFIKEYPFQNILKWHDSLGHLEQVKYWVRYDKP